MFTDVKQKVAEFAEQNASTLLTAGGVVGVVGTGILSGRAGFKLGTINMQKKIDELAESLDERDAETNPYITVGETEIAKKDLIVSAAPELIPPVITGAATIFAIIYSNRMSAQKAAALAAAYGLAERNFAEYKEKVSEKLTGPKRDAIKDEIAQEAVDRTPGHDRVVVVEGEVLCFDMNAGRYFHSTVEKIRQAANTTNAEVINRGFAPVSFFYDELDLDGAPWADHVGFGQDNMLELDISTTLKGGKPCVTINFVKPPRTEYGDPKEY
jgi:ribosomal protein L18E